MSDSDASTREDRIYDQVLRMVLWGEKEEAVFQKLEVNGFTGNKAKEMYAKARAERVSAIRGDCLRSVGWGLLWFGAGSGVFYMFWYVLGGITRLLLMLTVGSMCAGAYMIIRAVIGFLAAPLKEGSLAEGD
jgi:hypothetical protein